MNKIFIYIIKFYRYFISPLMMRSCRFEPSCSQYALEAYQTYGIFTATSLTFKRIFRCHPWGGCGFDPLPKLDSKTKH